jgi:hypothetical protein
MTHLLKKAADMALESAVIAGMDITNPAKNDDYSAGYRMGYYVAMSKVHQAMMRMFQKEEDEKEEQG